MNASTIPLTKHERTSSPLNEAQIFLLQAFSRINSEEEKAEIQTLLIDYYQKRVDSHAKNISFSNEEIEGILTSHCRTPYK
jgi:hypothetical protein